MNTSPEINIVKILLLYYALIASSYAGPLLGKQLKEFIQSNRLVQHLVGFMALVILINTVTNNQSIIESLKYAILVYILFILTTKLDLHWNIIIISMMFVYYIYECKIEEDERELLIDRNVSDEKKKELMNNHYIQNLLMTLVVVSVVLIGTTLYSHKKHVQYGGGYNMLTYFIG